MVKRKKQSPALAHVQHVWDNAMRGSFQRLNGAMHSALRNAVNGGMTFEPDDFRIMAKEIRLGCWIGEGGIDAMYSRACGGERGTDNPSAVAAIEKYLGRKPFIWAEETKTATRLHVGSRFTWKGELVTVTSFNDEAGTLTAVTYKREKDNDRRDPKVGSVVYEMGEYRTLEAISKYTDGSFVVRFSDKLQYESEKIVRRFTVAADELKSVRADYDKLRKSIEKNIDGCETLRQLDAVAAEALSHGAAEFRHFDFEIIKEKFAEKREELNEALSALWRLEYEQEQQKKVSADLERWANGEDVRAYFGDDIRIRVKGDFVEASNGNKVSIAAARSTIKFVCRHRAAGWHSNGQVHDVDAFKLRSVDASGVEIGCTRIPWSEVDRCAQLLKEVK